VYELALLGSDGISVGRSEASASQHTKQRVAPIDEPRFDVIVERLATSRTSRGRIIRGSRTGGPALAQVVRT
jgi:hypothetical protein